MSLPLSDLLGDETWGPTPVITGVTSDSRSVRNGYLFAALPGVHTHGLSHVTEAVSRGAVALLVPSGVRPSSGGAVVIEDENTPQRYALLASRFYGEQPHTVVAVTGTNGKTSVAMFARHLWTTLGEQAGVIGTLGIHTPRGVCPSLLTTPEAGCLQRLLALFHRGGMTHVALEASSHGLAQFRLDGVRLRAAAFTNISQDHLDYHGDFESYFGAKLRLVQEVLGPGGVVVVNMDGGGADVFAAAAREAGHRVLEVGRAARHLRLLELCSVAHGQKITLSYEGQAFEVSLSLRGEFQISNALVAAGLVMACGGEPLEVMKGLETLRGVVGRLEEVGRTQDGAPIFVDYAHTPEALEMVLNAVRPHVSGRLHVVFGCGGERDPGKRVQMGRIAAEGADEVIVCDDNPRGEVAASIRAQILSGCPRAREIGERATAIEEAIKSLGAEDALVIAGKGHELSQHVGDTVLPFSDHQTVRRCLGEAGPLWSGQEVVTATRGRGRTDWSAHGVSIDSRTLKPGDLFIPLRGLCRDGHQFLPQAFEKGACAALAVKGEGSPVVEVEDTREALCALGSHARARSGARLLAVTGTVGKTSVKDALQWVLGKQGETHASEASYNNQWGVPLSLARLPGRARFGVFELGMSRVGEIAPLSQMVLPHVALITAITPVHMEFFGSLDDVAASKGEIFHGLAPGGVAVLNRGSFGYEFLHREALRCGAGEIVSFGEDPKSVVRLIALEMGVESSQLTAQVAGQKVCYAVGAPGRHMVLNSLAVLAGVHALGADVVHAAAALGDWHPLRGRGEKRVLPWKGGVLTVIDESYNASPASVEAALSVLCAAPGRRVAVLGDMAELGERSRAMHEALADCLEGVDLVLCCGPQMRHLYEKLPAAQRTAYAATAQDLCAPLVKTLKAGDVIMIKGSRALGMEVLIEALGERI